MKKYFLLSLILLFLAAPVFAQIPSFEIAEHSWPDIENGSVSKVGDTVIVRAEVTDISGISSVVAIIKNSEGVQMGEPKSMYDNGTYPDDYENDDVYGVRVDVSTYPTDTYNVYISATDNLRHSTPLPLAVLDTFPIEASICRENNGAEICIDIFPTTNLDQISSFTINDSSDPVSAMAGTAVTLKANLGVSGQIIFFTDQTASINIGSAVTDSSGIATIQYTTSLGAVIGSHTLAARYAGGSVPPSQKTATLNVTSAGNCKENQNAAICITVSISTTPP